MAYDLKSYGRGVAYIFVNENYEGTDDFKDRYGARKEYKNLKRMFRDLTFKLQCYKNVTNKRMIEELRKACSDPQLKERSCFVCVICSHGVEKTSEAVHAVDGIDKVTQHYLVDGHGNEIKTDDIMSIVRDSKALRDKPKLFFIQACREDTDTAKIRRFDLGINIPGADDIREPTHQQVYIDGRTTDDIGVATKEQEVECKPVNDNPAQTITDELQEGECKPVNNNPAQTITDELQEDVSDSDTDTDDGLSEADEKDVDYFIARRRKIQQRRLKEEARQSRQQAIVKNDDSDQDKVEKMGRPITVTDAKHPRQRRTDPTVKPLDDKEPVTVVSIPCYDDMLVMFASNHGKYALRDSHAGGVLVSSLCHVVNGYLIEENAQKCLENTDFLSILTEVVKLQSRNNAVMEVTYGSSRHVTTVPVVYHKLTKDLYIPIMKPRTLMHILKRTLKSM